MMISAFLSSITISHIISALELVLIGVLLYYALVGFIVRWELSGLLSVFKFQPRSGYTTAFTLPKKVFLIRHGQSLGNVKMETYTEMADWSVPLTEKGKLEAANAGLDIKRECGDTPIVVYYSPYKRTKETMKNIVKAFPKSQILLTQQEPRIREQDFGNFQNSQEIEKCKNERLKFSRFFYRFPMGESGADVYDRISSFMESLFRLFMKKDDHDFNLIIVSHGLTIRIILMRWFRWSVSEFETISNPKNATPVILERLKNNESRYTFTADSWSMLHRMSSSNIRKKAEKLSRQGSAIGKSFGLDTESSGTTSPVETKLAEVEEHATATSAQSKPQQALEKLIKEEADKIGLGNQEVAEGQSNDSQGCENSASQEEEEEEEETTNIENEKMFYKDTNVLKSKLKKFEASGYEGEFENGEMNKFNGVEYVKN